MITGDEHIQTRKPIQTELQQLADYEVERMVADGNYGSRGDIVEMVDDFIAHSIITVADAVPPSYAGKVMLVCWTPDTAMYIVYEWDADGFKVVQQNQEFAEQYCPVRKRRSRKGVLNR